MYRKSGLTVKSCALITLMALSGGGRGREGEGYGGVGGKKGLSERGWVDGVCKESWMGGRKGYCALLVCSSRMIFSYALFVCLFHLLLSGLVVTP